MFRKGENSSPEDEPVVAFVLQFWLFEIVSKFGFRVSNLFLLGHLCVLARGIFVPIPCTLQFLVATEAAQIVIASSP